MTEFENIDERKAHLLKEFIKLSQGKKQDELLPLLLAFSNKAREEKITFDKKDIDTIFESMKKDMVPEELGKIETIMKMASVL